MPVIHFADDIYAHDLKIGEQFIYRKKVYSLYDYSGTIYQDKETFKVFTEKGRKTFITIPKR